MKKFIIGLFFSTIGLMSFAQQAAVANTTKIEAEIAATPSTLTLKES